MKPSKSEYERFSLTIPKELNDWLYNLTQSIKMQGGYRIPKTTLVRAMIRSLKDEIKQVNLKNIRSSSPHQTIGALVNSSEIEEMLITRFKKIFHKT